MNITLREINRDNWRDCVRLKVSPDQERFVASNAVSLAQSKYEEECIPLAVYDENVMVGFVMYRPEDYLIGKIWFIERIMIGEAFQGKGYGRATMELLLSNLRSDKAYKAILISFVPDNIAARQLYTSVGFEDTGEIEYGEVVFRFAL